MPLITTLAGASARGYGGLVTFGGGTSYESIATTTVGSGGSANVEFTSIPATYTHLQIRCLVRTGRNDSIDDMLQMTFNSTTTNYYRDHYLYGQNTTIGAGAESQTTDNAGGWYPTTQSSSNIFGPGIIDILDYANTNKYKTSRVLSSYEQNTTSGALFFNSGLWMNTNAITSIKFTAKSGQNIQQYSQFALYGIKGA